LLDQSHIFSAHLPKLTGFTVLDHDEKNRFYACVLVNLRVETADFYFTHYVLDLFFREGSSLFFSVGIFLVQIAFQVLEDKVKFFGYKQHFFEFSNIWMIDFSEGLDLSQFEAFVPIVVFTLHFFDSDYLIGFAVDCLVDSTECPVTQNFYYPIFLHSLSRSRA